GTLAHQPEALCASRGEPSNSAQDDGKPVTYRGIGSSGAVGEVGTGIPIFDAAIIALDCCEPYQARLKRKNANTAHHTDPAINPIIPRIAPPMRPIALEIGKLRISPNGNQSKPRTI